MAKRSPQARASSRTKDRASIKALPKRPRSAGRDPRKAERSHTTRNRKTGAKKYGTRADLGAPVTIAFDRMPQPQKGIAYALDDVIRTCFRNVESKVSWGNAGYWIEGHDLFAIWQGKDYVSLAIGNGAIIPDPTGLLEGTGKLMRHVKVRSVAQTRDRAIAGLLRRAAAAARAGGGSAFQ